MTEIYRTIAGSRLYGTNTPDSDYDYKSVHLPTKRQILLGKRGQVISRSTGNPNTRNNSNDVDLESFELQRFLSLAADMQTIPVEMFFVRNNDGRTPIEKAWGDASHQWTDIWHQVHSNKHKILNRNTKAFVGYCKGQAVRYSMRGKRLDTFEKVCALLADAPKDATVKDVIASMPHIPGVYVHVYLDKRDTRRADELDVYGRKCPVTLRASEALKIYQKPVKEAGQRAKAAKDAGGMDNKALYHAVRIADEGISLFSTGTIEFPCQNRELLMKIRAGEVEIDEILDIFDEKIAILEAIGDNSPLAAAPDREWIDDFVADVYEDVVRA